MAMGDERYESADLANYLTARAAQLPSGGPTTARTSTGRRVGRLDNGTVALALGGMTFYWLMPALLARGRKGRRVVRPARRPQRPATTPPPAAPSETSEP